MTNSRTAAYLRDLARRVESDDDRSRLDDIADVIDSQDTASAHSQPAPGTVETVGGAKVTHRPDLAYHGQAALHGEPGFLPVRNARAAGVTHVMDGTGGTHQAPEPIRLAEPAAIGTERR